MQAALHVGIVRDRPDDRRLARRLGPDPAFDQLSGIGQQPGADPFFNPWFLRLRTFSPIVTRPTAISLFTPTSRSMMRASRSRGGYVNSIAMKRCLVLCLRSFSTLW